LACGTREGRSSRFIDADGLRTQSWLSEAPSARSLPIRRWAARRSTLFDDDKPMVVNGAGGTVNRQGWAGMPRNFENES